MLRVLNDRKHPGKRACDRISSKKSFGDKGSEAPDYNALTGTNLLNLNVNDSLGVSEVDQVRRGDLVGTEKQNQSKPLRKGQSVDCTTIYSPNGQSLQKNPLNKQALQVHKVEHWQKFSVPCYEMVLQLENYHVVKDRTTSNFYVQENNVKTALASNAHQIRKFNQQNKRKEIDTFYNLNESRFEPINKSPKILTNVKKVTGLSFYGYKERTGFFPD